MIQPSSPAPQKILSLKLLLAAILISIPAAGQNPAGALSGREIVISPGHGYYWHTTLGWIQQRPVIDGLVEDRHTHEIIHDHVLPWLERSGARTILCRARSRTQEEHVIQNDFGAPAYTETGSWTTSASSGFGGTSYRFAATSPGGGDTASFQATIGITDHYPVYVAFRGSANRTTSARVEITHAGGTSWRTVDMTRFDRRWLYVGTFPFRSGETAVVTLTTQSNAPGVIISDAVKIGDGFGINNRGGGVSGFLKWQECSRYHAEEFGAPSSVYNSSSGAQDNGDDVTCRPRYGEWFSGGQADLFLSLHTNAGGGSGTSSFIYNGGATAGSAAWQSILHNRVVSQIRSAWDPTWIDRGQQSANFGELRLLSTMPGVLLELAFHDDIGGDIEDIHHPDFRAIAGRAIAHAMFQYLAPGMPLPLDPPTSVALRNTGGGDLTVSWQNVAGATSYLVRTSTDGFAFDEGTVVTGTAFTIANVPHGELRFAKVAALNISGAGIDSEPAAARAAPSGFAPLLLVNGFDRRDRSLKEADNPRNWLVPVGSTVASVIAAGYPFDSCSNEAVGTSLVQLPLYRCVGWVLGEESTRDESFSNVEQFRLSAYLSGGGRLFYSGAEVGWDLDWLGSAADRSFYENTLGQNYVADDSNTYSVLAQATGPLAPLPFFTFSNGNGGLYDVNFPDVVSVGPGTGGQVVMSYATGGGAAVLHGNGQVLGFGFPLESIVNEATRNLVMERVLSLMCPLPLRLDSIPGVGLTTNLTLDFPNLSNQAFVAAASLSTGPGLALGDGRTVPLQPDFLFSFSLTPGQGIFLGFAGALDAQGQGSIQVAVPNDPSLSGLSLFLSAVTVNGAGVVSDIAPWVRFQL